MKEIPIGFVKMDLRLLLMNNEIKKFEDIVLSHLLSHYYVYYTKVICKTQGLTELYFYCKPNDAQSIAYHMGCWAQTILEFHTKKKVTNFIHSNPNNFPECIHININPKEE